MFECLAAVQCEPAINAHRFDFGTTKPGLQRAHHRKFVSSAVLPSEYTLKPVYYWVLQQLDAKSRDRNDINPVRRPLVVRLQRNTVPPVKVFSFYFYLCLGYFDSVFI